MLPAHPRATRMSALSWPLVRWFASSSMLAVPQAGGPVAFSLMAVTLTNSAKGGAAMILVMTLAQIAGAIPVTRLGRRVAPLVALRLMVAFRTLALAGIALGAWYQVSFTWLVILAIPAGSVNGAAYGYLRPLLNHLSSPSGLPRALGLAATMNEVTFVLAPVLASGIGAISPVLGVAAIAVLGGLPVLLIPTVGQAPDGSAVSVHAAVFTRPIALWLACVAAESASVSTIEISAVALALDHGYEPALAILFTVPLCIASIAGGTWITVRNRTASRHGIVLQMMALTFGSFLVAGHLSLETTIAGIVLEGLMLAPLGAYYSLILDALAPSGRRQEVFALLRTSNAVGVIVASGLLMTTSLSLTLLIVAGTIAIATITVAFDVLKSAQRP